MFSGSVEFRLVLEKSFIKNTTINQNVLKIETLSTYLLLWVIDIIVVDIS